MEYNGRNQLTKITVREAGAIYKTVAYTYADNKMEYSIFNASGGLWSRFVYIFDGQGNVTGYDMYNTENTLTNECTCNTYDDKKIAKGILLPRGHQAFYQLQYQQYK